MKKNCLIGLLVFVAVMIGTHIAEAKSGKRVIFSVVPVHAPEKIWQLYYPVVEYLNKNTPINWEFRLYTSHEALEEGVCKGDVHIILTGPFLAYRVYKGCGAKPILLALNDEGKVSMKILLITMDPEIKALKDLKGKKVGLFKPITAAYIVTKAMLEKEGLNEQNTQFIVFQGLDRLIEAMMAGTVSAIGLRDNVLVLLKGHNYREIKVSEPIPGFVFMASTNAPETVKTIFIRSMLKLKPLSNKGHELLMQGWDETIKYGFINPTGDYLQLLERNNMMYGRHIK
jgi:ABC-type phosphate/phosphonate transport system substrate-binding protein